MRVAILYDAGSDEWSPQDVAAVVGNVHEVRDVLRRRGHEVELLPVRMGDFRWLNRVRRADLVFNLCEGINGHARFEDYVVGTLELAGVPFTGCRHWAITIAHRKHVANTLLSATGLPVPAFTLAQANKVPSHFPLPAIVKPAAEHVPHLVDVAQDRGHVLRAPLVAAGIVQDRNAHQATSARSERPLIRRQATSATARMRSS